MARNIKIPSNIKAKVTGGKVAKKKSKNKKAGGKLSKIKSRGPTAKERLSGNFGSMSKEKQTRLLGNVKPEKHG